MCVVADTASGAEYTALVRSGTCQVCWPGELLADLRGGA
jgi:hypothetical protein